MSVRLERKRLVRKADKQLHIRVAVVVIAVIRLVADPHEDRFVGGACLDGVKAVSRGDEVCAVVDGLVFRADGWAAVDAVVDTRLRVGADSLGVAALVGRCRVEVRDVQWYPRLVIPEKVVLLYRELETTAGAGEWEAGQGASVSELLAGFFLGMDVSRWSFSQGCLVDLQSTEERIHDGCLGPGDRELDEKKGE